MNTAIQSGAGVFNFARARVELSPFPHFYGPEFFDASVADRLLDWFRSEAPWSSYDVADFGSYNELNLRTVQLPPALEGLRDDESMARIAAGMEQVFAAKVSSYIDIMAHKLSPQDAVGVHSDNDGMLSHRLILHVHHGWTAQHGGELVLHENGGEVFPPARAFAPQHRAALAFEISPRSFHSIRRVEMGERYTLVYGFFRP
jgi:Rps23 Pro-64 3,4-dihydroxylase Tpa1-like proline 4-hydroxylase